MHEFLAHTLGRNLIGFDLDLLRIVHVLVRKFEHAMRQRRREQVVLALRGRRHLADQVTDVGDEAQIEHAIGLVERSEEHTSELQSLMRISYAVFCLKKKKQQN